MEQGYLPGRPVAAGDSYTCLPVRIVVNADDFGLSQETLAATVHAFEAGLLTSASLMVGVAATDDAVEFALGHPEFSYGVHLVFVGDGTERPVCDPDLVSDLVDADGRLLPTNIVRAKALRRRISVAQIERETVAQVKLLQARGLPLSHVDSHRHLHKFPPFRAALVRALPGLGIRRVRTVQDTYLRRPVEHPTYWLGPFWRRGLAKAVVTTDHFYMPTTAHDAAWHELASRLPRGETLEVGIHPGQEEEWRRAELASLPLFVDEARRQGHELVGWDAI